MNALTPEEVAAMRREPDRVPTGMTPNTQIIRLCDTIGDLRSTLQATEEAWGYDKARIESALLACANELDSNLRAAIQAALVTPAEPVMRTLHVIDFRQADAGAMYITCLACEWEYHGLTLDDLHQAAQRHNASLPQPEELNG